MTGPLSRAPAADVGTFVLSRVPGSNPPEYQGEVTVHTFVYRLRGAIELRDGRPVLVGRATWSPSYRSGQNP
jgi:hypothetical protein